MPLHLFRSFVIRPSNLIRPLSFVLRISVLRVSYNLAMSEAPASFSQIYHSTRHRQGVCVLAMLTWVASCDGRIHPKQQLLLDKLAEAVDDVEDLSAVESAARLHRVDDLTLACRFLKENFDRGGKRLLAQLAITMAIQDGYLSVGENHLLQFLSDLLGLGPRVFGKLFLQIAHRPFPQPGDPSSPDWWRRREAGASAAPAPLIGQDDSGGEDEPLGPMSRVTAFRVLGLDAGASRDSVHKAYRHLAMVRHPDRFSPLGPAAVASAAEAFKRLHEAYAVLST
jgi:DnaJ like chaperone protein